MKVKAQSLTIEQASIENESQMELVINLALNRFGKIDGVIHAAGVAGAGIAQFKSIEEFDRVLTPKLQGTDILVKLLQKVPLDFMVFVSSLTSILGYPGQVDYCSANRILDAYANSSLFNPSVFCVAMNWQAWRDVGMAEESETKLFQLDETNSNSTIEGINYFEKILNSNLSQVIISNSDPNTLHIKIGSSVSKINDEILSNKNKQGLDEVTKAVLAIWQDVLGIPNIQLDDDFYELGGHSLLAIMLLSKLNHKFNIKIPSSILFKEKTARAFSNAIKTFTQKHANSALVILKQGEHNKPPLFIIHPIGGTVFCYLPLVEALEGDRTYYGIQDPSLEFEKSLFSSVEEMATFYRKVIQEAQVHGPYYLCGASFGATVVTEIAHQLRILKEEVHFAGLIDGWAGFSSAQLDVDYIDNLKNQHRNSTTDIIPHGIENASLWEKMLQHRLNMMASYSIKKIDIKLSLFKARDILSEYKAINVKDNHWGPHSILPIDCFTVPGDHNSMLQKPNVNVLAEKIQGVLSALDWEKVTEDSSL